MTIKVGDVLFFDPDSLEEHRLSSHSKFKMWMLYGGMKQYGNDMVPYASIGMLDSIPDEEIDLDNVRLDVLKSIVWCDIPCSSSSSFFVLDKRGSYMRIKQITDEYGDLNIENKWVPSLALEYGLSVGLVKTMLSD